MRRIAICLGASKIFMRTMIRNENTLLISLQSAVATGLWGQRAMRRRIGGFRRFSFIHSLACERRDLS